MKEKNLLRLSCVDGTVFTITWRPTGKRQIRSERTGELSHNLVSRFSFRGVVVASHPSHWRSCLGAFAVKQFDNCC